MSAKDTAAPASNVISVGEQNFASSVLHANLPMIVDFTAEWCPPCRALSPVYARLSKEYAGKVGFASVDCDAYPMLAANLHVQAMPTVVFFNAGAEVGRIVGPHPGRLQGIVESLLASSVGA